MYFEITSLFSEQSYVHLPKRESSQTTWQQQNNDLLPVQVIVSPGLPALAALGAFKLFCEFDFRFPEISAVTQMSRRVIIVKSTKLISKIWRARLMNLIDLTMNRFAIIIPMKKMANLIKSDMLRQYPLQLQGIDVVNSSTK